MGVKVQGGQSGCGVQSWGVAGQGARGPTEQCMLRHLRECGVFFFWGGGEHKLGRGRERGTEDLKWALCRQADSSEPDVGLELTNCEIMT